MNSCGEMPQQPHRTAAGHAGVLSGLRAITAWCPRGVCLRTARVAASVCCLYCSIDLSIFRCSCSWRALLYLAGVRFPVVVLLTWSGSVHLMVTLLWLPSVGRS